MKGEYDRYISDLKRSYRGFQRTLHLEEAHKILSQWHPKVLIHVNDPKYSKIY